LPVPPSPLAVFGLPQTKFAYEQAVLRLSSGLKGLWSLQETSGTAFKDSLGLGGATAVGTVTAGQAGPNASIPYSVNFNTGYANTGYQQASVTKYTFACWFKTTANSGMLFGGRSNVGLGSLSAFIGTDGAGFGGNGRPRLLWDAPGVAAGYSTLAAYHDGNWHHGVWVCDTAPGAVIVQGHMRIHIDGASLPIIRQDADATAAPFSSSGPMQIAADGRNTSTLVCNLAMVSVWERVLSGAEIAWLYRCATVSNR